MPTNNNQYIEDCQRTLSDQFHPDLVNSFAFDNTTAQLISFGETLDLIKKALFYGKANKQITSNAPFDSSELFVNVNPVIVHGIIGKVTESIELLEALMKAIETGEPLDLVNIKEEIGDCFWYDAILAKACGFTFEEAQAANINKLKARYPEKFTSENAIERDLEKEREILESENNTGVLDNVRFAWECKIGSINGVEIPSGGDFPMREAVEKAYFDLTGIHAQACFSGWGSVFTESEKKIILNN
jgi:NTP pyrophosphatase (non-canonical NTP hydrolase)